MTFYLIIQTVSCNSENWIARYKLNFELNSQFWVYMSLLFIFIFLFNYSFSVSKLLLLLLLYIVLFKNQFQWPCLRNMSFCWHIYFYILYVYGKVCISGDLSVHFHLYSLFIIIFKCPIIKKYFIYNKILIHYAFGSHFYSKWHWLQSHLYYKFYYMNYI